MTNDPFKNIFQLGKKPKKLSDQIIIKRLSPLTPQRTFLKRTKRNDSARFTDHDRDGVISGLDCFPFNKKRHNAPQVLWHAGNKKPSETLSQEGRVYGFTNREYAEGWQQSHNKSKIYRFTTNQYDLDRQQYVRQTSKGKKLSDNEYIAYDIDEEDEDYETEKEH